MVKICLDSGHSLITKGKETSNFSKGVIKEWTLNDAVCRKIENILKQYENVEIYRTDDTTGKTDVSLSERVKRCNKYNPDLFVSIHHNAYSNKTATGTEVFWHSRGTKADKEVANLIAPKLASKCGLRNRGVKQAEFAVLTCKATAVLVEGAFMTTESDYNVITSDKGQDAYAQAVAEAIIEYFKLTKKKVAPTTKSDTIYRVICGSYSSRDNAEKIKKELESKGYKGVWIQSV